ncbi:MAG TPA: sulfotransferase [Planctomycetaceae bacterium]|nr:sulfotransferase [Planctomycetaceae bacterium]
MQLPHILYFSTLRNWLRLLWRYGRQIDADQWPRAVRITLFVMATIPIRVFERARFGLALRRHRLSEPPIFIVGHWRSGTTNMHNLMLQDPQFASVTMLHCAIPSGFLTWEWLARRILARRLPKSRPMDAVPLGIDEPMSEDFALAGLTHMSHYLNYFFPQIAEQTFRETVLFEGVDQSDVAHWSDHYEYLLRKVSYASGGRRLLLKNPPNLGRVPEVLKRFPDAKFIHVYRNPWLVHASTMKLMQSFIKDLAFQTHDPAVIESFISHRYQLIMEKWFADRHLIPRENLIELRHEDIVANPVQVVETIYRQFGLSNWATLQPKLEAYARSLQGYQNNAYSFDSVYLNRIHASIGPIAKRLDYAEPQ